MTAQAAQAAILVQAVILLPHLSVLKYVVTMFIRNLKDAMTVIKATTMAVAQLVQSKQDTLERIL